MQNILVIITLVVLAVTFLVICLSSDGMPAVRMCSIILMLVTICAIVLVVINGAFYKKAGTDDTAGAEQETIILHDEDGNTYAVEKELLNK